MALCCLFLMSVSVMLSPYMLEIIFSSIKVAKSIHLLRKSCSLGSPCVLIFICNLDYFSFWF